MQRKRPVIDEKINQLTKHPEVPQVQVFEKTVEISQLQAVEKIVETPQSQTIQGIQTSESLDTAPFCQVHLTGVMKPDDPDAKIKLLAEERHGVGGFVFDAHGNRVANELGGRNCVTGEMWKNEPPFSLALNKATSDDIGWQCKHYTGRGVRRLHTSGTALVEDVEAPVSKMPDSIEAHCQASLKSAKDPDGEPYPAFASEKSWNEASGKTGSEKTSYHNVSSGADFAEGVQVSENLGIALAGQLTQAETVEAVKIGTRLPAEDSGTQTGPPDPESTENSGGATCAILRQCSG